MTRLSSVVILGACIAAFGAASAGRCEAIVVRDGTNREVKIADTSRIVSIGGAVTEILYALGSERRVVAVDATSLYPPEALKTKPNVGYFRQLSPEGVMGVTPSLIIAVDGAGPKEAVSVLEAASVPLVRVADAYDGEGILRKIRLIAHATGLEAQGRCLEHFVSDDLAAVEAVRAKVGTPVRAMFVISFVNGRAMIGGRGTAADGLMRMAGAVNVFDNVEGYKIVSDEAVMQAAPEAVLSVSRPGFDLDAATVFQHPAFSQTPAARRNSFVSMEALYMLGFGPRAARAARDLSHALYPDLVAPTLPSERASGPSCAQ
jgi:iron complex transport system substrate-binding protein